MTALGDCYDQVVFLQQAVQRAVRANDAMGLWDLVRDAQGVMGARGSALNLDGSWVTPVPDWLHRQDRPSGRVFGFESRELQPPEHVLGVPFTNGWVAFWDKPAMFTAGDARLAETLGDLISATEEAMRARAERILAEVAENERATAARIWRRVVPETLQLPRHYAVTSLLRPAREVGGDFLASYGDWIVIGDVSGKGVPAALFTGMFVSNMVLAVEHDDVGEALARSLHGYLEDAEMFASVAALKFHPDGRFQYLNMGHPPIYIRRASGAVETLKATAPPLGTFRLPGYPLREGRLQAGDLLCLYTDGLSEAERETPGGTELFGLARLEAVLHGQVTREGTFREIMRQLRGWTITDDFTLALVQYNPEAA
ncbi:PP2C family protein-serine/threonine phosphatase [Deinococcus malanensis]|nr:PP2C family protein-serine/threonine phosphatase [Deinococcus malanensis]